MFELIIVILFCWLSVKTIGLALSLTWGVAKVLAAILFVIAVPVLFVSLLFAGGVLLLLPLALIAGAAGILKACTYNGREEKNNAVYETRHFGDEDPAVVPDRCAFILCCYGMAPGVGVCYGCH